MKIKRVITLCLALTVVASLAACGKEEKPANSSAASSSAQKSSEKVESSASSEVAEDKGIVFPLEEKMTFTMMNRYEEGNPYVDMPTMLYLEEMTNIHFEHIEYVKAEYPEKFNLLLASDEYGDIFVKANNMDFASLGADGYVIPLEDLIREYAPNLAALFDELNGWSFNAEADGHIYQIPQIGPKSTIGMWYNEAWMKNAGINELPANMDEFTDMLRAFKEKDVNGNGDANDEIPLLLNTNVNCTWASMMKYMTDSWRSSDPQEFLALMAEGEYEGKIVYYPRTEEFKEHLLEYLVTWYEEGLVNQDLFTADYNECNSIGLTSNIYGTFFNSIATQCVPEANLTEYHWFRPFEKGYMPLDNGMAKGSLAITDKCEHPEILMKWIDYIYTTEGGDLMHMGVEGIDYEIVESGGWKKLEGARTIHGGGTAPGVRSADGMCYKNDLGDATYLNPERFETAQEYGKLALTWKFTEEQTKRLADLKNNIDGYTKNYVAQVVVGEISLEDTWENFQKTLVDMGVEELESIYAAGYEAAQ